MGAGTHADACPACPPGDAPAAFPADEPEQVNGGTLASYRCVLCGTAWRTWFDYWGWPAGRQIEPLSAPREPAA